MAFQQALSGLNTASKAIDVTSHNIANSSTVGYKSSSAHFADVYAASLTGAGASQVGLGVSLAAVQQQFTQGNITATNNPLDISINGGGFFRMDNNGDYTYTRNGQFHLDSRGFIVNDQGFVLTGFDAVDGVIARTPVPLQIGPDETRLTPQGTGLNPSSSFNGIQASLNLDSRQLEPQPWADGNGAGDTTAFNPNPATYNYSTALSVYDTLGNPLTMTFYFRKTANPSEWEVYANVEGTTNQNINGGPGPIGTLTFGTNGVLTGGSPMNVTVDVTGIRQSLGQPNSAEPSLTFDIDFFGTTQFGNPFGTSRLAQDGYAGGDLAGVAVGADGVILGRYSNGQNKALGQVLLANFSNPNGLKSIGNNQWTLTSDSGPAMLDAPDTAGRGVLSSSSIEESNVDLTAELVNLITQQRNYQANAQSIKTQDQVLQTLVNLR